MAHNVICEVGSLVNWIFAAGSRTPHEQDQAFVYLDV
jgi:hypothetical protein